MKTHWSLVVSRAVSQLIMRVHKPPVAYELVQLRRKNPKGELWCIIKKNSEQQKQ